MTPATKETLIRYARNAVKGLGYLAGACFVFAPVTEISGLYMFVASIGLALICMLLWGLIDWFEDSGEPTLSIK